MNIYTIKIRRYKKVRPALADTDSVCNSCRYCARYFPEIYECLMHCMKRKAMLEGLLGVCDEWKAK